VPWVAREFESGAFRFTWTQGTGPRHWLLGTFGPLVLLAAVSAAIYGAAAYWWYQVAQWQDGMSIWSWRWSSFELTPLSIAGWTVLAMALAQPIKREPGRCVGSWVEGSATDPAFARVVVWIAHL
jgi:hypothetical protein